MRIGGSRLSLATTIPQPVGPMDRRGQDATTGPPRPRGCLPVVRSRLGLVAAAALLLSGCALPYARPVLETNWPDGQPRVVGLSELTAGGGGVDVVFIHGMCFHDGAWVMESFTRLAALFGQDVATLARPAAEGPPVGQTELYSGRVPLGPATEVGFHAILWSGETVSAKQTLCYDRSLGDVPAPDAAYCEGQGGSPYHRARLNATMKSGLLDECLADAMVYVGHRGAAIRENVAAVLERIARANGGTRPLVIVAESLGSKVLFDTLLAMAEADGTGQTAGIQREAVASIVPRIAQVHLAANQIPMLSLAATAPGQTPVKRSGQSARADADSLAQLLRRSRPIMRKREPLAAAAPLPIAAYSDPNDLLSIPLLGSAQAREAAADGTYFVTDVIVSNAPTWLGLLADPMAAHTSYLANDELSVLLKCGLPAVPSCAPGP